MATHKIKILTPDHKETKHTHRDNWEVMKPFVRFSIGALKVIAGTLVAIIKALPLLKPNKSAGTSLKRKG